MQIVGIQHQGTRYTVAVNTQPHDFPEAFHNHLTELSAMVEDARVASDALDIAGTYEVEREAKAYIDEHTLLDTALEELGAPLGLQFAAHVGALVHYISEYQLSALERSPFVSPEVGHA